jgi:hypothetical protein
MIADVLEAADCIVGPVGVYDVYGEIVMIGLLFEPLNMVAHFLPFP